MSAVPRRVAKLWRPILWRIERKLVRNQHLYGHHNEGRARPCGYSRADRLHQCGHKFGYFKRPREQPVHARANPYRCDP